MKPAQNRTKRILLLAIPLIGAMLSQNLLNHVDTFMVGLISTEAIAAVAAGGTLTWLASSIVMSLSTGVQQLSARRFGQGQQETLCSPLNAGLLTSLAISIPSAFLFSHFSREIFSFISIDPPILEMGSQYLSITFMAIPFFGINYCFRGYWNGINRQSTYMYTLFIIHGSNILLNYLLIFGKWGFPQWGTNGAAIASLISLALGTCIYVCIAFRQLRKHGFARTLFKRDMNSLLKLSSSNAAQAFLFALSYNVL